MTARYLLNMQSDPVGRFQEFLAGLYEAARLDALLVPLRIDGGTAIEPRIVEEGPLLQQADPFTPVMLMNSARLALDYQRKHSKRRFGVVLRPCELRALATLHEQGVLNAAPILKIGVDCMGTFEPDDLSWTKSPQPLAEEALHFARQGGINLYRYRLACQICIDPLPADADISVDLLGLPARTTIVVSSLDSVAERYQLASITDGEASMELIAQHERVRQQVLARRKRARQRLGNALNGDLAMDVDSLTTHLKECEICQTCFAACPIYEFIIPERKVLTRDEVMAWLLECAGCGMCEAACSDHLPLTRIISQIRLTISEALEGDPINS